MKLLKKLFLCVAVLSMLTFTACADSSTSVQADMPAPSSGTTAPTTEVTMPPTTEATVPPTTEATAPPTTEATTPPTTEATVPPTTEATAPPTTEATTPPTTEATVPPTTEATVPPTTEATAPPATEATAPPATEASVPPTESNGRDYILNNNTMKFHFPSCGSADKIKPENKAFFTGTRDELIAKGYSPCGNCHP